MCCTFSTYAQPYTRNNALNKKFTYMVAFPLEI